MMYGLQRNHDARGFMGLMKIIGTAHGPPALFLFSVDIGTMSDRPPTGRLSFPCLRFGRMSKAASRGLPIGFLAARNHGNLANRCGVQVDNLKVDNVRRDRESKLELKHRASS